MRSSMRNSYSLTAFQIPPEVVLVAVRVSWRTLCNSNGIRNFTSSRWVCERLTVDGISCKVGGKKTGQNPTVSSAPLLQVQCETKQAHKSNSPAFVTVKYSIKKWMQHAQSQQTVACSMDAVCPPSALRKKKCWLLNFTCQKSPVNFTCDQQGLLQLHRVSLEDLRWDLQSQSQERGARQDLKTAIWNVWAAFGLTPKQLGQKNLERKLC